jgi:hypothetical protein
MQHFVRPSCRLIAKACPVSSKNSQKKERQHCFTVKLPLQYVGEGFITTSIMELGPLHALISLLVGD